MSLSIVLSCGWAAEAPVVDSDLPALVRVSRCSLARLAVMGERYNDADVAFFIAVRSRSMILCDCISRSCIR